MKNFISLILGILAFSNASLAEGPLCAKVFIRAESKFQGTEISFTPDISQKTQNLIRETIAGAQKLYKDFSLPKTMSVTMSEDPFFVVAGADSQNNKLLLANSFLSLPEPLAKAVIAHEYTHLVVTRGFKSPGATRSLYEELVEVGDDSYVVASLISSHMPYAELLCDLAPVLMTRDPKIFVNIMQETQTYILNDKELSKKAARLFIDKPFELSSRDFSVSDKDPRWADYHPNDLTYNRFNQIRSYLWNRWIKNLPKEKEPAFFKAVFTSLGKIFEEGRMEEMMMFSDVPESNRELIQFLEERLSKEFHP